MNKSIRISILLVAAAVMLAFASSAVAGDMSNAGIEAARHGYDAQADTRSRPEAPSDGRQDEETTDKADNDCICEYRLYNWNSARGRTEAAEPVRKPCTEVTPDERDPLEPRCTVCRKDQVRLDPATLGMPGVKPFMVCRVFERRVRDALARIAKSGSFEVTEIVGYRPGRTRGPIKDGFRTVLSNHSFGTAIDINPAHNGLYKNCTRTDFKKTGHGKCRLSIGGKWDPSANPRRTITDDSIVVKAFSDFWKWGGDIPGGTRDLMHFSISGF
ncbi:MAG TPA: M15 family metallopeptidase [Myxococcota bacterium]|nr:M15 family metallopeptidase [Myxococcota bacterium]